MKQVKHRYILAPMDDVTDTVFRQVVASCAAPDLCFSEFVNVDGLMNAGRNRLVHKLEFHSPEPPLVAHIWGLNPDNFYKVADQLASGQIATELGLKSNYAGIDLNMGCPARVVVRSGACSALIKNPNLAKDIIQATKAGSAGRLPVSVKTRLGYDVIDEEWTRLILSMDIAMMTIHLRTSKEMSLVPAHYNELIRIKKEQQQLAPKTIIIANGDIISRQQADEIINKYQVDGVMIGRGVFSDPFVFSNNSPWSQFSAQDKINLFIKHLSLYLDWSSEPNKAVKRLNKYAKIYINNFSNAKDIREQISNCSTIEQMITSLNSIGPIDS